MSYLNLYFTLYVSIIVLHLSVTTDSTPVCISHVLPGRTRRRSRPRNKYVSTRFTEYCVCYTRTIHCTRCWNLYISVLDSKSWLH